MEELAPPIGPYSHAVKAAGLLFVSGQIPVDPQTGKVVEGGIEAQTQQVIDNLEAVLRSEGLTLENVVKTEVYLKNMDDFKTMNMVYAERFSHSKKPARQAMQVGKLPLDVLVEISCIAAF